jgi:hypothetical protein
MFPDLETIMTKARNISCPAGNRPVRRENETAGDDPDQPSLGRRRMPVQGFPIPKAELSALVVSARRVPGTIDVPPFRPLTTSSPAQRCAPRPILSNALKLVGKQ